MFYLQYLLAEMRRRPGRTAVTALGLAVGVGLVVIVGALSRGLDDAQDAGAGAAGPAGPFGQLSRREQRQLERENDNALGFDLAELGEPGERFSTDRFLTTELSFPASEVAKVRQLDGAEDASASLTVTAVNITGTVPEVSVPGGAALHGGQFDVTSLIVSGVDVRTPGLAMVAPGQITTGRYLSRTPGQARAESVVDLGYARQNDIGVGDELIVAGAKFEVVGLAAAPLGGDASNAYVELGRLQRLSDRRGRANEMQVRAESADTVDALADRIARELEGADVVTAADLAERVGGSLADADDLSSRLGTALAIVALLAAFLIATLLTLSSVQKRIRELGTLKALGWRQRLVVRQVAGESLVQGAIGGLLGAVLGIAGASIVDAIGPTLEASVEARRNAGFGGPFGQGNVTAGSTDVVLGAPVNPGLLLLAIALAIVGGLLAGAAGGLRAARLRPADALRSAE